ncbi:hypothetical protein BCR33DRAFT_712086 [Rhizoclosmatium globosum]|uniref:BZIP domain-containing protein n=1 Tax=Rhizoclosmatium globosum TaxID=329046 RepID=A0A1Y2CZV6_9FUNG|nr:hypothetical protein BCR33DRAFT_712086 [Rhizoclosmatium globosum]|eukprot:ORY51885.1 hypothetical protein BCR33DRAFT_712086 [Rhizoclosmatium globosum]
MTSTSYNSSPAGLFGSSLLEDDLFAFGTNTTAASSASASTNTSPHTTSFDFNASCIESVHPSVLDLFGAESSMFTSLFPDAVVAPPAPAPVAAPEVASLSADQAAQLLASTEAAVASNPGLGPVVARLRQSLVAAASVPATLSPAMSTLSSVSPATQCLQTPLFGFEDFGFGNVSPVSAIDNSPLFATDAFAVPWSFPAQPSATAAAPSSEEKPKSKAGRKRKERPNDPIQLLQELDLKRQRNTESARRSRVKRMAELDQLHCNLASAQEGEKKALEKVKALEAELQRAKELLARAGIAASGVF